LSAENLDVVDFGSLKADHGASGNAEHGCGILPRKGTAGHHVPEIQQQPDCAKHQEIDDTHHAGDDDGRICF
jgi:hypothetical protein